MESYMTPNEVSRIVSGQHMDDDHSFADLTRSYNEVRYKDGEQYGQFVSGNMTSFTERECEQIFHARNISMLENNQKNQQHDEEESSHSEYVLKH